MVKSFQYKSGYDRTGQNLTEPDNSMKAGRGNIDLEHDYNEVEEC